MRISIDESEPTLIRMTAMRAVLPYFHSASPIESTHTHLHAAVDPATLMDRLLQRLDRIAPTGAPPVIDAEPVALEPEPVAAD